MNPWITIWLKPKETIQRIIAENPKRGLWVFATIYGFVFLLNGFQSFALGYTLSLLTILFSSLVFAPLFGIVAFAIWSWIVYWVGKLLGGKGNFQEIRAAYAWSCAPFIWTVLLWFVALGFFNIGLFRDFPENYPIRQSEVAVLLGILVAKLVLAIWSFIIFINALAAVQQFSTARSILNIIFAWVVVVGVATFIWWGMNYVHALHAFLIF